jgi:hypothetical protein
MARKYKISDAKEAQGTKHGRTDELWYYVAMLQSI